MRILSSLGIALLCMTFLISCEKTPIEPLQENISEELVLAEMAEYEAARRGILVQSRFSTFHCPPSGPFCVCQTGSGSSPHLGQFEAHLNFCVIPPFPAGPTDPVHYAMVPGEAYISANGQEYYIRGSGTVFPVDHPRYGAFFKDEFEFYEDGDGNPISGFLKLNSKVYDFGLPQQETRHIMQGVIVSTN